MNFLGMGPMELMMILVLALIVFGPGKLPEIAGQVGRAIRDFRRMTGDLSSEFNRTLSLEIEERRAAENGTAPPEPVEAYTAPAAEPTEAPPYVAPEPEPVLAPATETPVIAGNGTEASAPAGGSKRRTFDPDLAPPY